MVEKIMKPGNNSGGGPGGGGGQVDLYDTVGHHHANNGGLHHNGVSSHPLSSANPPGLPRPPLHPVMPHTHGHSHLMPPGASGGNLQHNGSPMQRLTHPEQPPTTMANRRNSAKKPYLLGLAHHGHGPAPPPPTQHISNNPPQTTSSQHPMSNLSSTSGSGQVTATQPSSQSLVSNGGLNGHANMGTQLFGDTEPENEKWWWVCCLEFCFCLL